MHLSRRKIRTHHQIDVTTGGLAPLAELLQQGPPRLGQLLLIEALQTLVHQIERVVNELGCLFGSHGITRQWRRCRHGPRLRL